MTFLKYLLETWFHDYWHTEVSKKRRILNCVILAIGVFLVGILPSWIVTSLLESGVKWAFSLSGGFFGNLLTSIVCLLSIALFGGGLFCLYKGYFYLFRTTEKRVDTIRKNLDRIRNNNASLSKKFEEVKNGQGCSTLASQIIDLEAKIEKYDSLIKEKEREE